MTQFDLPLYPEEERLQRRIAKQNKQALSALEALIDQAIAAMDDGEKTIQVTLEDKARYEIVIQVRGEGWDACVDERVARFVLGLQSTVDRIAKEAANHEIRKENRVRVKVRLEKGCTLFNLDIGDYVEKSLKKMNGTQTMIALIVGIIAVAGYSTASKYFAHNERLQSKAIDEETKQFIAQSFARYEPMEREINAPKKGLVNQLAPRDTIQLPGDDKPRTKKEAKALYPQTPRSESQQAAIDGEYYVQLIDTSGLIPVVSIKREGFRNFKANMPVMGEPLTIFFNKLLDNTEQRQHQTFKLQVDVKYNGRGIQEAVISGLGDPREGSVELKSIINPL